MIVNGSMVVWATPIDELAEKVIFAVCAGSVNAALKEMFCEPPGFNTKLDGCAATPLGNPLSMTEIEPVKSFNPEADRDTWPALPPGVSVKLAGLRLSEKSAAGVTVSAKGILCWINPSVPTIEIDPVPMVALRVAERGIVTGIPGCT